MTEVFEQKTPDWTFAATVPQSLRATALPLPPALASEDRCVPAGRSAAYWRAAMTGQDFSREDHLDAGAFNLALWRGLKGDSPYPIDRDGRDLSTDRLARIGGGTDKACVGR
jgi:hypothetical protein